MSANSRRGGAAMIASGWMRLVCSRRPRGRRALLQLSGERAREVLNSWVLLSIQQRLQLLKLVGEFPAVRRKNARVALRHLRQLGGALARDRIEPEPQALQPCPVGQSRGRDLDRFRRIEQRA